MKQSLCSFIADCLDLLAYLLIMNWPIPATGEHYREAIMRALYLFDAEEDRHEAEELEVLTVLMWEHEVSASMTSLFTINTVTR